MLIVNKDRSVMQGRRTGFQPVIPVGWASSPSTKWDGQDADSTTKSRAIPRSARDVPTKSFSLVQHASRDHALFRLVFLSAWLPDEQVVPNSRRVADIFFRYSFIAAMESNIAK